MTDSPSKRRHKPMATKKQETSLDLDPNAWPKFEALVKSAAKMGHKPHHSAQQEKPSKAPKRQR
jgi:hypothetical protein